MNIINEGLYTDDNPSLLKKTKKIVKIAIKGTAYTAFLGIAVASMLHLYNNPKDRASVAEGFHTIGQGIKAKYNDSYFKLTGSTLSQHITKAEEITEKSRHEMVKTIKETTPTKEDAKKIAKGTQVAGSMVSSDVKEFSPSIGETIKKDAKESTVKAKSEVNQQIKKIRQYSGDLTEKVANYIKP